MLRYESDLKFFLRKMKWKGYWAELHKLIKAPGKLPLPCLVISIIVSLKLKTSARCLAFFLASISP